MPTPIIPVAGFNAIPTEGQAPLSVQFTDTSTNAVSWSWTFGDGTKSVVKNPSHTYAEPGTYSVILTATGEDGSDTEEKTNYITVTPGAATNPAAPVAAFKADVTSGQAPPLTVQFTDTSTNSPDSYSWNFGDGTTAEEVNPAHIYTQPGTYTVTLKVTNADGTDTETKTGYISVTDIEEPSETTKPVAAFSADSVTGPAPMQVTFTDQSQGIPTSWTWYFGGGASSYEQNPTHTYTEPGTYSVTLRVINAEGIDFESKSGYITVTDEDTTAPVTNPPVAAFSADVVSGTVPLEVTFTDDSSNSPDSWSWNFGGDGWQANVQNPSHTYTQPGIYAVTLEVTNDDGADVETKTGYISVIAAEKPTPTETPEPTPTETPEPEETTKPVAAFSADSVTGPAPMQVTFTDQSQGVPTSWTWYFGGGGASSYEQNPTHTYTEPGTYSVTLRVINAEGIDFEYKTGYITVTDEDTTAPVTNPPVAAFSADVVSGTVPLEVTFTDESSNSPDSWSWNFGDGTTAEEENPRTHLHTTGHIRGHPGSHKC
ncbi:PKD domain-containing protein [Methanogenium cariaci]|uniref:PKD domain-containing protein n=1 Tax=Methanogenium cariaci TaxID=2197 RepID=UPI001FE1CF9A|nr:PKD domain-containing protein [Methanogenium cariaci]